MNKNEKENEKNPKNNIEFENLLKENLILKKKNEELLNNLNEFSNKFEVLNLNLKNEIDKNLLLEKENNFLKQELEIEKMKKEMYDGNLEEFEKNKKNMVNIEQEIIKQKIINRDENEKNKKNLNENIDKMIQR